MAPEVVTETIEGEVEPRSHIDTSETTEEDGTLVIRRVETIEHVRRVTQRNTRGGVYVSENVTHVLIGTEVVEEVTELPPGANPDDISNAETSVEEWEESGPDGTWQKHKIIRTRIMPPTPDSLSPAQEAPPGKMGVTMVAGRTELSSPDREVAPPGEYTAELTPGLVQESVPSPTKSAESPEDVSQGFVHDAWKEELADAQLERQAPDDLTFDSNQVVEKQSTPEIMSVPSPEYPQDIAYEPDDEVLPVVEKTSVVHVKPKGLDDFDIPTTEEIQEALEETDGQEPMGDSEEISEEREMLDKEGGIDGELIRDDIPADEHPSLDQEDGDLSATSSKSDLATWVAEPERVEDKGESVVSTTELATVYREDWKETGPEDDQEVTVSTEGIEEDKNGVEEEVVLDRGDYYPPGTEDEPGSSRDVIEVEEKLSSEVDLDKQDYSSEDKIQDETIEIEDDKLGRDVDFDKQEYLPEETKEAEEDIVDYEQPIVQDGFEDVPFELVRELQIPEDGTVQEYEKVLPDGSLVKRRVVLIETETSLIKTITTYMPDGEIQRETVTEPLPGITLDTDFVTEQVQDQPDTVTAPAEEPTYQIEKPASPVIEDTAIVSETKDDISPELEKPFLSDGADEIYKETVTQEIPISSQDQPDAVDISAEEPTFEMEPPEEEKPPSPIIEDSLILSDKPASPDVEDSLILSEKPASPEVEDSLILSDKPASPDVEDSLILSEKPASPEVEDSLMLSEKQSGSEIEDTVEKPASAEVEDSLIVSGKPVSTVIEDTVIVSETKDDISPEAETPFPSVMTDEIYKETFKQEEEVLISLDQEQLPESPVLAEQPGEFKSQPTQDSLLLVGVETTEVKDQVMSSPEDEEKDILTESDEEKPGVYDQVAPSDTPVEIQTSETEQIVETQDVIDAEPFAPSEEEILIAPQDQMLIDTREVVTEDQPQPIKSESPTTIEKEEHVDLVDSIPVSDFKQDELETKSISSESSAEIPDKSEPISDIVEPIPLDTEELHDTATADSELSPEHIPHDTYTDIHTTTTTVTHAEIPHTSTDQVPFQESQFELVREMDLQDSGIVKEYEKALPDGSIVKQRVVLIPSDTSVIKTITTYMPDGEVHRETITEKLTDSDMPLETEIITDKLEQVQDQPYTTEETDLDQLPKEQKPEETEDIPEPEDVDEFQETLPDGTVVTRRIVTRRYDTVITRTIITIYPNGRTVEETLTEEIEPEEEPKVEPEVAEVVEATAPVAEEIIEVPEEDLQSAKEEEAPQDVMVASDEQPEDDVEEITETLPDGTIVKRRIVKKRIKVIKKKIRKIGPDGEVTEEVITEEVPMDADTEAYLLQQEPHEGEEGYEDDIPVGPVEDLQSAKEEEAPQDVMVASDELEQPEDDVEEITETLPDGTIVKRRIIKKRIKVIKKKIRKIGPDGEVTEEVITEEVPMDADTEAYLLQQEPHEGEEGYDDDIPVGPEGVKVYADTLKGDPVTDTDVQEFEETLPDGTIVKRRVVKTRQKQMVVKRFVMEGPEGELPTTDEEAHRLLAEQAPGQLDPNMHLYVDRIEGEPEETSDVQEFEETLPDGTVVKRRVLTTKKQQMITEHKLTDGEGLPEVADMLTQQAHAGTSQAASPLPSYACSASLGFIS